MQDKTLIRLAFQVFGAPVAYVLLQIDGFLGLKGWQWLFIMVSHSIKQLLETCDYQNQSGMKASQTLNALQRYCELEPGGLTCICFKSYYKMRE